MRTALIVSEKDLVSETHFFAVYEKVDAFDRRLLEVQARPRRGELMSFYMAASTAMQGAGFA